MAIDTKAKRASVAGLALPFLLGLVPDAAQPQEWRQAAGWSYYGIDAAAPAAAPVPLPGIAHAIHWRTSHAIDRRPEHAVEWRNTAEVHS